MATTVAERKLFVAGEWVETGDWIDRATGVAGAFLTQVLPFFDARIVETATQFEQAVYAEVGTPVTV